LLHDLIATYDWLSQRIGEATPHLRGQRTNLLWLNVDDPRSSPEEWTWRSASQLVFDLRYDSERHYDVKAFLGPYKELLLAAGAHEQGRLMIPGLEDAPEITHPQLLISGWESLRQNGLLLDIEFPVGDLTIKAHKGVLAATIDHFRDVLTNGFAEGSRAQSELSMVFPVPVGESAFAVQSVVGQWFL
jgi:hypothetical protein